MEMRFEVSLCEPSDILNGARSTCQPVPFFSLQPKERFKFFTSLPYNSFHNVASLSYDLLLSPFFSHF